MTFTPQSSFSSLKRLGRKSDLLERDLLPNGMDIVSQVKSFILEKRNNGGLLTILGHPSAGKTTEFNRIARNLQADESLTDDIFPLYSEFQNSELSQDELDSTLIWKGIISGCVDINVFRSDNLDSLETFCSHSKDLNRTPVIMIDTLDILMLYNVDSENQVDIASIWSEFLESAILNKVVLIWTCRPFEWKYFKEKIDDKYQNKIEYCDLPLLSKDNLSPFPELNLLDIDCSDISDFNIENAWNQWSVHFQQYMPIFADRWADYTSQSLKLDTNLFKKLGAQFRDYTTSNLDGKHWWEFADKLPTEYLYFWIFDNIKNRLTEAYGIDEGMADQFKQILEEIAKMNALSLQNNSSRVRLRVDDLNNQFKKKLGVNSARISDFYKICKSRGLLTKNGIWVDFHHQLLFEEAVINSADDDELDQLKNFSSILLRSTNSIADFIDGNLSMVESTMNLLGHWMGYSLSYHPDCAPPSPLGPEWKKWTSYRSDKGIHFEVLKKKENQDSEKQEALKKFFSSDGKRSLLVNGAPGTGKTWFCKDYLQEILARRTKANQRVRWRYFTVNTHLAEHFNRVIKKFSKDEPEFAINLANNNQDLSELSIPISRLLRDLNPKIKLDKKWNDVGPQIGLLTFSVFKNKIREYYSRPKVKNSGNFSCPPISDAWQIYNEVIHDPVSGNRVEGMDEAKFESIYDGFFTLKGVALKAFLNFHKEELAKSWYTYSYASHLGRKKLESLPRNKKKDFEIDVLIVDEVQDISPPVMALLLELMDENFEPHSLMIAGDVIQTVNRSNFDWIDFSHKTQLSLSSSKHPRKSALSDFGVTDSDESRRYITTLTNVWRNGKRLIEFNNFMRKKYGSNFGVEDIYGSKYDYPDSELVVTPDSKTKDEDSMIVVYEATSTSEYEGWLKELSEISEKLVGQNVALITPFELTKDEIDELKIKSVLSYDAESIKGLEFNSVIILMPYMLPLDEARASIKGNISDDQESLHNRIQKQAVAWKSGKTKDPSYARFENFHKLFLNMKTRMNVLFSRPEKRILVFSPIKFGKSVQLYQQSEDKQQMVSFGSPEIPYDKVEITDTSQVSILDALTVSSTTSDISNLIDNTLAISSLNDDGSQADNERIAWDNLWHNIKDDSNAPRSSVAYAAGLNYRDNIEIFKLLRSDLGREDLFTTQPKDKENQLADAICSGIPNAAGNLHYDPHAAYYILSELESMLRKIMHESLESQEYQPLHKFMMRRLFGIDTTLIDGYDFERFIQDHISMRSGILEDFSLKIKDSSIIDFYPHPHSPNNNFSYEIPIDSNDYRDVILRHLFERMKFDEYLTPAKLGIVPQNDWVQESNLIWKAILQLVNDGDFDTRIIQDKKNKIFVKWITETFRHYQPRNPVTGTVEGILLPTRKEWKGQFESKPNEHPMRKAAWRILNDVIPKLHNKRSNFTLTDEVYLSVYDALRLKDLGSETKYDAPSLRILHDILELSFRENIANGQSFEESQKSISNNFGELLYSAKESLAKHMGVLSRYWLDKPDFKNNNSQLAIADGKSVLGSMIHLNHLMNSGFKEVLTNRRQSSIIRTLSQQFEQYFSRDAPQLERNEEGKWAKYHLQQPIFRHLLGSILQQFDEADDAIFEAQTTSAPEKFLSRLLLIEFVALTDEGCNESTKMKITHNNGIPVFYPANKDALTQIIIKTYLNSRNANVKFFKNYADELRYFLPLKERKQMDKTTKWVERPRYFTKQIWHAWEWMLHLLKKDQQDSEGESKPVRKTRKRTQSMPIVKSQFNQKWQDAQYKFGQMTHNLMRISYDESLEQIYNRIDGMYRSLQGKITSSKFRENILETSIMHPKEKQDYLQSVGHDIMRFTGVRIDLNKKLRWEYPMRIIYSQQRQLKANHPFNYVDWELCFEMWRSSPGSRAYQSFSGVIEDASEVISQWIERKANSGKVVRNKQYLVDENGKEISISFKQIVDENKSKLSELTDFMRQLMKSSEVLAELNLGLQPSVTKSSIFSISKEYDIARRELLANLIKYLLDRNSSSYRLDTSKVPKTGKSVKITDLECYNHPFKFFTGGQEA